MEDAYLILIFKATQNIFMNIPDYESHVINLRYIKARAVHNRNHKYFINKSKRRFYGLALIIASVFQHSVKYEINVICESDLLAIIHLEKTFSY